MARLPRRNVMLSGSIEAEGLDSTVRIRNLSESGAMIEGAVLPRPGSKVILRRLDYAIDGRAVWHAAGRCGIEFDAAIVVEEWAAVKSVLTAPALQGQARVDAVQRAIRAGTTPPKTTAPWEQPAEELSAGLSERLAGELAYARRLLDSVGEELVRDPLMVQRHGQALQTLDMACQLLGQLGTVVGATDPLIAAREVTIDDLRSRLVGKPIF